MAQRGAKPKPTALKLITGSRKPSNPDEPVAVGDLDTPPEWLTEQQQAGWRYAIDHAPNGLLKMIDRSALIAWVVAEDLHRQASQKVATLGMIVKTRVKGEAVQNPYLPIVNRQAQIMLRAAAEMGFTPSSRTRVSAAGGGDRDANPFSGIGDRNGSRGRG